MNKTQVRSAKMIVRDDNIVSMCFYSDLDRSTQISKYFTLQIIHTVISLW